MDSPMNQEAWLPTFYVGQHESKRTLPVTDHVLRQAHDCNASILSRSKFETRLTKSRVQALVRQTLLVGGGRETQASPPTVPPLSLPDTTLSPGGISSQLLALVSPWIDLCSPDPIIADVSRQVLYLEVAFAAFCGIEYIFVPGPRLYHGDARTHGTPQYARAIQEVLSIASHAQIHIMLPMVDDPSQVVDDPHSLAILAREDCLDEVEELKPQRTDVYALSLPRMIPPLSIQSRWFSEPVKLISLTPDTFVKNAKGNPVLFEPVRSFISRLMRQKVTPWILLCDVGPIPGLENTASNPNGFLSPGAMADASTPPTPAEAASYPQRNMQQNQDSAPHLSYMRYCQRNQPPRSIVEQYCSGYQDHLQFPLQPLTDNLENMTYEVFEKDPVKYDAYEEAIRRALRDWVKEGKPASGPNGRVVVTVAGAGRGPLVTRALRASEAEGVEIDMWAIEKNPNAYVLLQRHNAEDWNNRVTIVQSDMRSWKGPWYANIADTNGNLSPHGEHGRIDILISELLGSFADNELSPECLDGILHLLNATHGISIPQSYTAFLTPLAAPKLHQEISSRASWDPTAPDAPAVVWLHAIDYLSLAAQPPIRDQNTEGPISKGKSRAQTPASPLTTASPSSPTPSSAPNVLPTWTFYHGPQPPLPHETNSNAHNKRHVRLSFRTRNRGVCHGFGGYFESVLYPGAELSTNPNTIEEKSAGMISWFPIFFPLKTPLYLPDHSLLTVNMWRQTDGRKVWYEWMVESWGYNLMIGGEKRLVRLGGGEVSSSVKVACLM
ncbi:methyltransferase protein [Trapelia coarctata]|nr:methyltransferase protein [Trapelia coarctata]